MKLFSEKWKYFFKTQVPMFAIGEIKSAFLTEAEFQSQLGSEWILCDGRDVSGSKYHNTTGNTNIPDIRGRFLRALDNGAGVDPDSNRNLGDVQVDDFKAHTHELYRVSIGGGSSKGTGYSGNGTTGYGGIAYSRGGAETRPKNIAVNYFIKVN